MCDRAIAGQASQPLSAGDRADVCEELVSNVTVAQALAVEGQRGQVGRAAVQAELVPVNHTGDRLAVAENVRQVQIVVCEVSRRQAMSPHWFEPAPEPVAKCGGRW